MSDTSVQTTPGAGGPTAPTAVGPAPTAAAPAPARPRAKPGLTPWKALQMLASLRLTVALFTLSLLLVFFGTVAQIDSGIWTVVDQYFWSWIVLVKFKLISQFMEVFFWVPAGTHLKVPGAFPLPAGKLVGLLMMLNLGAAYVTRFRWTWKRSGILMIHAGIILLFVGEAVTRVAAVEANMVIDEGASANFVTENRKVELAVIDATAKDADGKPVDRVTVIPQAKLGFKGAVVSNDQLPFKAEVVEFMVNSRLREPEDGQANPADQGTGVDRLAVAKGEVSGTDTQQKAETPSVYLKLTTPDGTDLGTWLFSTLLEGQEVKVGDKVYDVALRFKRTYKPYKLELKKFSFDRYPGTNKAKNFSSEVVLIDPAMGPDREVLIRMNEPLRHRGETFYQSSFDSETEKTTILQVVNNPGWLMPYWSCVIVSLGLIVHFVITLNDFLLRRAAA